jgi:hypothetical protein
VNLELRYETLFHPFKASSHSPGFAWTASTCGNP